MTEPLRRHKQYKNRKPEDTITVIQDILKGKLGLGLYERSFKERNGLFYSCRILLDNGTWFRALNIGTNGKGMTEAYSRASAYGELMERIQNGVLLPFDKDTELLYHYAFDEQILMDDILLKDTIDSYILSFDNQMMFELNKGKAHYYIPYYNIKDGTIVQMPLDIIFNSISTNGLCAGNTPQEAIIEGLGEIMERYVIRKIYQDNLALPRIPRSYFEGNEVLERMEELEKIERYHIEIIDCSLGVGIPAVGIVITTEDKSEYQFHMGVDPSPITALERSLTELFQGRNAIKFKQFEKDYQKDLNVNILLKEAEIHKTYCASTGAYPFAFFSNTSSYEFNGFDNRLGWSDETDLKLMIELIKRLGFNLYIRDNSFLGFPAYSLYVPGMTELYNVFSLSNMEHGGYSNWEKPESAVYDEYVDLIKKLQEHALEAKIDQMSLKKIFH